MRDGGLSAAALAGIIAAGALIILLLVVFLFVLLTVAGVRRRRAAKPPGYKTEAHDNPTYMSHSELNAAGVGQSPIDVVFDAHGAVGVAFYADDEKKKVRVHGRRSARVN